MRQLAKKYAVKACSAIRDEGKKDKCVELLTRAFANGENVREEMRKHFTREELDEIRERMRQLLEEE